MPSQVVPPEPHIELASLTGGLPTLVFPLADRRALEKQFSLQGAHGGLFAPGMTSLPVGQRLALDVTIAREHLCLQARAVVRWVRHREGPSLPRGAWLELLDSCATEVIIRMLGDARVRPLSRARRFEVRLPVHLYVGMRLIPAVTRNISRTGALLETASRLQPDTSLSVRLLPPRMRPLALEGRIVRAAVESAGLAWTPASAGDLQALEALLAELQARRSAPPVATTLGAATAGGFG